MFGFFKKLGGNKESTMTAKHSSTKSAHKPAAKRTVDVSAAVHPDDAAKARNATMDTTPPRVGQINTVSKPDNG